MSPFEPLPEDLQDKLERGRDGLSVVKVSDLHAAMCGCHAGINIDGATIGCSGDAPCSEHAHPFVDARCSEMWDRLMRAPAVRLVWDGAPLLPRRTQ